MINKRFFLSILFLCVTTALFARGNSDKKNTVKITGLVRLTGAEPFTQIVISSSDGNWFVADEDRAILQDLQYRLVTVEGVASEIDMKFANGSPAGIRRELRKVKIIEVHQTEDY